MKSEFPSGTSLIAETRKRRPPLQDIRNGYHNMMITPDVNDTIIISNSAKYYSLAHEFYHIFAQQTHVLGIPSVNLFAYPTTRIVTSDAAGITNTKRLSAQADLNQEKVIHGSKYAVNP